MNRKKFLISSSLSAIALTAVGSVIKGANGEFTGDCETTNDILGPFYRPDSPLRADLTTDGITGTKIVLKGKVYGPDCVTPLKGAQVEIWQCNTEGEYDNESDAFTLRARWITNKDGEYSFTTILPGKYLNGRLYRPAHIHYRVTEKDHQELISQIYFQGDPHITEDPWASQQKAQKRILTLTPEDIHGTLAVHFDIYLKEQR